PCASPVGDPVGRVGVLLDLEDEVARVDRVDLPAAHRIESPEATETLFTHSSAVSAATALANLARFTPGLSPTKSDAPGTDCATYQFSGLDSPPREGATDAGGW